MDRDDFGADPAAEGADDGYRSLSGLAILALLLGLAAPLALLSWLLAPVPALAIVVGALALAKINANHEILTGRSLALTGVALGSLCVAAAFTKGEVGKRLLGADAEPIARQWIELVRAGEIEAAYRMSLDRSPPEADASGDPLAVYSQRPEIKALQELGGEAPSLLVSTEAVVSLRGGRTRCLQRYQVPGGAGQAIQLAVVTERLKTRTGRLLGWRVAESELYE